MVLMFLVLFCCYSRWFCYSVCSVVIPDGSIVLCVGHDVIPDGSVVLCGIPDGPLVLCVVQTFIPDGFIGLSIVHLILDGSMNYSPCYSSDCVVL